MRRPSVRLVTAAAVATLGATALAACGSSATTATPAGTAKSKVTLTLYSGQHEETTDALVKKFEAETGITVKVRSDDEDALAQQIETEGSRSPADAFFTENTPPLARLDEKGLLSTVDPGTLSAVPSTDNATDGSWVGVTARVSEIVYNTDKLKPADLPTSVLDLADPKWKGKLDIAPSETDFAPIVTSIAAAHGEAAALTWLEAIKANAGSHSDPDNETLVANVNKGTTEIGLINHYYWYRLKTEDGASGTHSALAEFAPHDDGYLLDVSAAGILKSSKHQAEAQQLLAFLVSADGQGVIEAGDSFEYPLRPGVAANPELPPFDTYQPKVFSLSQVGDGSTAVKLLQQAQLL
jgi:iron(III) transport system substrate-binding protein